MKRRNRPKRRNWVLRVVLLFVLGLVAGGLGWCSWVYAQIESYAGQDQAVQATPSGAIGVFGAAEYDGKPSPVYRARLDHALVLYHHGIAPLIITLGGNGGDEYNEGTVGREYLMAMGRVGKAHRRDRPGEWSEAAGDRQRWDAPIQNSRDLRRQWAGCADLSAAAGSDRWRDKQYRGEIQPHHARGSQLHGVADAPALKLCPRSAAKSLAGTGWLK